MADIDAARSLMWRVSVVGVTGSGKTTFAARLAAKLNAAHVELDALHWERNWTMAKLGVFRQRVAAAVRQDRWVVDGNYAKARDLVWERADSIVWLDYSFPVIFTRLFLRTIRRIKSGEDICNGNRESFATQFLSRESLFIWAATTFSKHRATFPALLADERHRHLRLVHLRAPHDAETWLSAL